MRKQARARSLRKTVRVSSLKALIVERTLLQGGFIGRSMAWYSRGTALGSKPPIETAVMQNARTSTASTIGH